MTKKEEILDELDELEELIQERITELNMLKGMPTQQACHAYMLYRDKIWNVRTLVEKL